MLQELYKHTLLNDKLMGKWLLFSTIFIQNDYKHNRRKTITFYSTMAGYTLVFEWARRC